MFVSTEIEDRYCIRVVISRFTPLTEDQRERGGPTLFSILSPAWYQIRNAKVDECKERATREMTCQASQGWSQVSLDLLTDVKREASEFMPSSGSSSSAGKRRSRRKSVRKCLFQETPVAEGGSGKEIQRQDKKPWNLKVESLYHLEGEKRGRDKTVDGDRQDEWIDK